MKRKTSLTTNSMKRPLCGAMGCRTAYPTCWSGSRAWAVSIKRGSTKRKGTGRLWRIPELSVLVSVALLFSSQLTLAQFSQQAKLVGTGISGGETGQGCCRSISLSSDGNTAIVGGPFDDGYTGAAWVYVRQKQEAPWWAKLAIDPMALILTGKALDIWYEIHHPHEPKVAEIQQVLRSMRPQEQKEALNRARILENYAKAEQKRLRSMTPEEQKAALNRVRTLENYGKAVKEAFATMKK
jgi:hypothetical protein